MNGMRIPLAFYTAVRGYSWHCTNGRFSEADLSLVEERLFANNAIGVHPIACVFTCGDRVFFSSHLRAENYDFNMRSADYYVVGMVHKQAAKDFDFKWIFENKVFAAPISRESALSGDFPPYLDYEGGQATVGMLPSVDRPEQLDSEDLSSIGSWIEQEVGDLAVYVANDIAKPMVEVKVLRKYDAIGCPKESTGSNESGAAAFEILKKQEESNEGGSAAGDSSRNPETPTESMLSKMKRLISCVLGFGSSGGADDGIEMNDRRDFIPKENHDMTHVGQSST